jgi:hypothetical protein
LRALQLPLGAGISPEQAEQLHPGDTLRVSGEVSRIDVAGAIVGGMMMGYKGDADSVVVFLRGLRAE